MSISPFGSKHGRSPGEPRRAAALSSVALMRGSVSNWWNGGGEDSVHSSVVAPSPHGLSPAFGASAKASQTP
jgi:hypothetical protein